VGSVALSLAALENVVPVRRHFAEAMLYRPEKLRAQT
jgi:hypothetical protein